MSNIYNFDTRFQKCLTYNRGQKEGTRLSCLGEKLKVIFGQNNFHRLVKSGLPKLVGNSGCIKYKKIVLFVCFIRWNNK